METDGQMVKVRTLTCRIWKWMSYNETRVDAKKFLGKEFLEIARNVLRSTLSRATDFKFEDLRACSDRAPTEREKCVVASLYTRLE